jgi:hypothetical protein
MDIKKTVTGTIVAGVLYFLLGWLIYGLLLANYFKHHTGKIGSVDRPEPLMLYLIIGSLFFGAFLTYIFLKAGVQSIASGFITGAIIGALIFASVDCMMYATTFVTSKRAILADVIAGTIMVGIIGAILAAVIGGKKNDS